MLQDMKDPQAPRYASTRWRDPSVQHYYSFEEVVLKGLAADGGLFHPDVIPDVGNSFLAWKDLSFPELAFQVIRPYVSITEIKDADLKDVVDRSYSSFRHTATVPLVCLDPNQNLHLLELFHGPTFAFKDVALQFLGNLFEFFLVRRNQGLRPGESRHHLTVIGATSGDTGSAAIHGLRGKRDLSIFIMFPDGKISPIQEAQMTTVCDPNVHNLSIKGTFDDCQDFVKALFADAGMNESHHLAAVNSINWARILAQITYYFYAYFQLLRQNETLAHEKVQFVVPTGNFGDILAGFYARQMGLPIDKLVIATNENDILHRFWLSGSYTKQPTASHTVPGGLTEDGAKAHEDGVKETLSPAMDILVSSNFERLLWHLAFDHEQKNRFTATPSEQQPSTAAPEHQTAVQNAGSSIADWFRSLKLTGAFTVLQPDILHAARATFQTYRISNPETISTIRGVYRGDLFSTDASAGYILDPHSAIGIAASLQLIKDNQSAQKDGSSHRPNEKEISKSPIHVISLATAHPAKFAEAVQVSLSDQVDFDFQKQVLPPQFEELSSMPRRLRKVDPGISLEGIKDIIQEEMKQEKVQDSEHSR